jgi:hypothetical protein
MTGESDRPRADQSALAARFLTFAERECAGVSPLYGALARRAAMDTELHALARRAPAVQPTPNLLFAAVHYLLRRDGRGDPLARYYPNLSARPAAPEEAFPAFKAFCRRHAAVISRLMETRVVATNEAGRAACLLPAFGLAARELGPFHLVEVGAAAGFNLLWDRFAYDYGGGRQVGAPDAALALYCRVLGTLPPIPEIMPCPLSRQGIDPFPVDVRRAEEADWLRALVWPEAAERAERLARAIELARAALPTIHRGEANRILPGILSDLPAGEALLVVHTFTLNQFTAAARDRFESRLRAASRDRPVERLALEWGASAAPELRRIAYRDGRRRGETLLALADAHGAWIDWRG